MPDPASALAPSTTIASDGFPKSSWTPPDTGVQLAPGGEAAARAAGYAPPEPVSAAPPASPQPAGPAPEPIPLVLPRAGYTRPEDGFKPFSFACPITFDGKSYETVGVRRFTAAQVKAISENFRRNREINPDYALVLPLYVDTEGNDLPDGVLDLVPADEADDLDRMAFDFLPRAFRPALEPKVDGSK